MSLLIISTCTDYYIAQRLEHTDEQPHRKKLLWVSIAVNLGMLGFFKYYDFFILEFSQLLSTIGMQANPYLLQVILPVGISFYTFQTLGYTVDVYHKKQKAERDFFDFALFVAFFPQLVAGPIEKARDLLTQFKQKRSVTFEHFMLGIRLFTWGFFKKVVIADNLAGTVDTVFANPANYDSISLIIAAYFFAFQIYCDFSGYTDMARGLARMMGFNLSLNFNLPYLATSIRDFWMRWHITLYRFLKEHVYIPLGGNQRGSLITTRNILVTFALSGLWHGAAWHFIMWGIYHGALLSIERFAGMTRIGQNLAHTLPSFIKLFLVINLVVIGWIIFRSENLHEALVYLGGIAEFNFNRQYLSQNIENIALFILTAGPLIIVQWWQHTKNDHAFELAWPLWLRVPFYTSLLILMTIMAADNAENFIYFQF